jgi:multicomponent Na+:H+ antiporter subunit B
MKGLWLPAFELPLLGKVLIGTPLVFDIGVYLTVIGFILLLADTLSSDEP